MMFRPVLENVISLTIFFYSARQIFQMVCDKINLGSKIRVPPPPGKMKNYSFLPKTCFFWGIFKSESPPGQTKPIAKSWFLPKILGRKWHYGNPIFEKKKSQPKIWQNSPNSLFDILIALNYSLVLKVRSILFLSKLQAPKTSIYLPTISLSIYYINPQRVHFQLVFYFFNFYLITPSWLILY